MKKINPFSLELFSTFDCILFFIFMECWVALLIKAQDVINNKDIKG